MDGMESTTGPAHREAHLFQVGLHIVPLITLDFHPAILQRAAGSAMRFQFLDQAEEVIGTARKVEHHRDGLTPTAFPIHAQAELGVGWASFNH